MEKLYMNLLMVYIGIAYISLRREIEMFATRQPRQ